MKALILIAGERMPECMIKLKIIGLSQLTDFSE